MNVRLIYQKLGLRPTNKRLGATDIVTIKKNSIGVVMDDLPIPSENEFSPIPIPSI